MRKQWSTSPNVRGLREDYPHRRDRRRGLAPDVLRRRRVDAHLRRRLAADAAVGLPRPQPGRRGRRLAADVRRAASRTTSGATATSASPAWAATRPTRPGARTRRCRPCRIGPGGLKVARAHTRLGWHWWPEPNSILSVPYDGRRPCVQRGTCQQGCNEGAKASTDLTHWPKAIALGARLVTGARVRRLETNAAGLVTGATWLDRDGGEHFEPAKVVVLAANAIGTLAPAAAVGLAGPPRRPGQLVRAGRQAADDASLRERRRAVRRGPRELAGPVRLLHRVVRVLRDGRAARLRPRREVGPGAHLRPDQRRPAQPGRDARSGGPTTTSTSASHLGPRRELGPVRRGPAGRGEPRDAVGDAWRTRPGSPRRRSTTRCPRTPGGCSTSTSRRRPSRCCEAGAYTVEVDRLMRYSGWHLLGTARMGDDPRDVRAGSLEPRARRPQPVRRGRQQLRDVGRASTPRPRSARSRCGPRTTWSRPASTSRCRRERPGGSRGPGGDRSTLDRRATLAAVADLLIPEAHGMPVGRRRRRRGTPPVRARRAPRPGRAARARRSARSWASDPAARLAALERDEPDRPRRR